MGNTKYDNVIIKVKKRDNDCFAVIVEYYRDNKLIDNKRTTNFKFIKKLLIPVCSAVKTSKINNGNLEANYNQNSRIIFENYEDMKNQTDINDMISNVSKKIKNNKKNNREEILNGIKNVRVSKQAKFFKQVALKTGKFLPVTTLSLVVMTQVVPIVKNLTVLPTFDKENTATVSSMSTSIGQNNVDKLFSNIENGTVKIEELLKSSTIQNNNSNIVYNTANNQANVTSTTIPADTVSSSNIDIDNSDSVSKSTTDNLVTEKEVEMPSVSIISDSLTTPAFTDVVKEQALENDSIPTITPNIENKAEDDNSLLNNNITLNENSDDNESLIVPQMDIESQIPEVNKPSSISDFLQDDDSIDNTDSTLTSTSTDDTSTSTDSSTDVDSIISEALSEYNLTPEEFDIICAVIRQEAGNNIEEIKNVTSTIINRINSSKWEGDNPLDIITASGQFEAYGAGHYKQYLNNNYDDSIPYVVASLLTGNMETTHDFENFRSAQSTSYGGTQITEGGNRYK